MTAWRTSSIVVAFVALPLVAHADKDRFEIGESVKDFTLKVINPDEAGHPYVGIDNYYGAEAKNPKKAILLSFFATYCEPCKREMPFLSALYDLYREKGLVVLSVSIDKEPDKIAEAKALGEEHRVTFPMLSDRFNIVAKRFYISKLPCVYIVDNDGKVAMVNIGYNDDISKNLLGKIRELVGESPGDPIPDALARYVKNGHGDGETPNVTEVADAEAGEETKPPEDGEEVAVEETKAKKVKPKKRKGKRKRRRKRK